MRRLPSVLTAFGVLLGAAALFVLWTKGRDIHAHYRGPKALETEVMVVKTCIGLLSGSAAALALAALLGLKDIARSFRRRDAAARLETSHLLWTVVPGMLLTITVYAYHWLPVIHKSHIFDLGL